MSVRPHPKQTTDPSYKDKWIIDFYPDGKKGKRARVPYCGTKAGAEELERAWRVKTREATNILHPKVNEVVHHFLEYYKIDHQPLGVERTARSLKILLRYFGNVKFPAIDRQAIEHYKRERLLEVKPTTINKELAALSTLCKWAEEMGYCEQIRVKRFPPKLTRAPIPDVPSKEDVLKLIEAIPWPKRGLFFCLYYGGLRSSEGRHLTVDNVNTDLGVMLITGKGNKQRVVPILDKLAPILDARLKEVESGLLWPGPNGGALKDLRLTIKWAKKRAGITRKYTPHTFRHAFGAHATMSGVNLRTLQDVMGHSTSHVTEIYTRLAAGAISEEMKKFK